MFKNTALSSCQLSTDGPNIYITVILKNQSNMLNMASLGLDDGLQSRSPLVNGTIDQSLTR